MSEQENNRAVTSDSGSAAVQPHKKERHTQNKIYRLIGEIDRPFLIVVIALVCLGSVMVFSASYAVCETRFGDSYYFARRQLAFVVFGIAILAAIARFLDYRLLKSFAYIGYVITLGLNFLVPFLGETKGGATRWFTIMGLEFQPSELLKFFLVLSMATYISNHPKNVSSLRKGILPLVMLGLPAALATLTQNHLSATIIMLMLTFVMVWLSGCKGSYLGIVAGAAVLLVVFLLTFGIGIIERFVPHAFTRIQIWRDPFAYMSYESGGKGWQPAQSLYAISSGGFWGLGLGRSNQKHGFLPEPQNDYIFAILCEELGFFGVICVIALFAVFAWRGYYIAQKAPNRFCSALTLGIISQVVIQVILNLAVVTNTIPSTGISLPFFSYGGTSLMILLAEMGIVLSISRYSYADRD